MSVAKATRFLHLSDLHLMACERRGACGSEVPACHVCIKRKMLEALSERLRTPETRPDLLLISGDLTELRGGTYDMRSVIEPLQRLVDTAAECGVAVAGITGEHDGSGATAMFRTKFGWRWLLGTGDSLKLDGVTVVGIEGRPNRAGVAEDLARLKAPEDGPSVVLLHDDLPSERPAGERDFSYYALGHRHRGRVHTRKGRGVMAYPGHLFSILGRRWEGLAHHRCGRLH